MPPMTKRVNVVTRIAVRTVNPPISGSYKNIIMSTSDILKCLSKRASVEEILPDGSTVKLNMKNYYLDNGAGLDAYANVDMDDKYNTDKDSKKNRGPIVHVPKKVTPTTKPTPAVEQKEDPIHQINESTICISEEEAEEHVIKIPEVMPLVEVFDSEVEEAKESLDTSCLLDPNDPTSLVCNVNESDIEEYTDEVEEVQTNNTTTTSNNNSYKKKKKRR